MRLIYNLQRVQNVFPWSGGTQLGQLTTDGSLLNQARFTFQHILFQKGIYMYGGIISKQSRPRLYLQQHKNHWTQRAITQVITKISKENIRGDEETEREPEVFKVKPGHTTLGGSPNQV